MPAIHRLAKYDIHSSRLASACRALSYVRWGALVLTLVFCVLDRGQLLALSDQAQITSMASASISVAATLGGLTTTIFFLSAQLRVIDIAQYGVTELFRLRDYLPLMGLVAGAIGFGLTSLSQPTCEATSCPFIFTPGIPLIGGLAVYPTRFAAELALVFVLSIVLTVILLGMTLMANLDPISVARKFARRMSVFDAEEWGLVTVEFAKVGTAHIVAHCQIQSNRKNFGLRDPLMPVHELVIHSNTQRFGQLLGVLLERVVRQYGRAWTSHAPDLERWVLIEPARAHAPRISMKGNDSVEIEPAAYRASAQLYLALLVIHYIRRIPRNKAFVGSEDMRRQAAQFQLARLIATMCTVTVPNRYAAAGVNTVIDCATNAILHISADFSASDPHGKSEGLQALAAAASVLAAFGREAQARYAVDVLLWCLWNTQQLSGIRAAGISDILRGDLAERWSEGAGGGKAPNFIHQATQDPWGAV
jgi:hypothetical protein